MTFPEFLRYRDGFYAREEMKWKRTYVLWGAQKKDPPSFDEFMGRAPILTKEEKAQSLWEQIEEERATGNHVISECGQLCRHRKPNLSL
jgi:hypothetical protein